MFYRDWGFSLFINCRSDGSHSYKGVILTASTLFKNCFFRDGYLNKFLLLLFVCFCFYFWVVFFFLDSFQDDKSILLSYMFMYKESVFQTWCIWLNNWVEGNGQNLNLSIKQILNTHYTTVFIFYCKPQQIIDQKKNFVIS